MRPNDKITITNMMSLQGIADDSSRPYAAAAGAIGTRLKGGGYQSDVSPCTYLAHPNAIQGDISAW